MVQAIAPEAVAVEAFEADPRRAESLFTGCELLSLEGAFPTAWLTRDISASGAIGDPRWADPKLGEAVLEHLAGGVARLFAEICAFAF